MLLKLLTLVDAKNAFALLGNEKLPYKLSWMIQRAIRKVTSELQEYEKINLELCIKYGVEQEPKGSGIWRLLPENNIVYQNEIKPILDEEVEIDINPIPLSLFDFAPNLEHPEVKYMVFPKVLLDLDWAFFNDEENVKKSTTNKKENKE